MASTLDTRSIDTATIDPGPINTVTATALDLGPARQLVCRECGSSTPLAAEFACAECFGPLEVAYDFGRITRSDIESGPPSIWRYRKMLPVPADVDKYPNTQPGLTRLIRARARTAACC